MAFDPIAASFGQEVKRARNAFILTSQRAPERWWTARELKATAKNGWSHGAANLALNALIEDGTFAVKQDKVRLNK